MYKEGYEEQGSQYHNQAKEKMEQLIELAREIYTITSKESDYCIPGDGVVAVTFAKDSHERHVLDDVARKYGLKF